ncbi:MAG: hypothetical protein ABIQ81_02285 [Novosphingobium sp.]
MMIGGRSDRRTLFVVTILTGSFLLFLVQPMVARMALPLLGGAPNVWNSAMLVYQALLLAGYGYAHLLGRMPLRRAAKLHLALLLVAALTLPIALVQLPPAAPGWEAVWVPLLLAISIGPIFLLVSAQAPLMQRWYASDPGAGEPWALYAASNLGSFAGLIAYPLVAEPLFGLRQQGWAWSAGYAALVVLVLLAARARWHAAATAPGLVDAPAELVAAPSPIAKRRIALWLALSAVPSGLLLSTTTHLTTDIFAMPLLWVIPLGLYLLSFVVAFADRRALARAITSAAPGIMLLAGGLAMVSTSTGTMSLAASSMVLLFVIAVALHGRLYDSRPPTAQLTLFYFVMSVGGALGGAFTALLAPLVFDWAWEHPLLIVAAAALLPQVALFDWRRLPGLTPEMARFAAGVIVAVAALLGWFLSDVALLPDPGGAKLLFTLGMTICGLLLMPWRWLYMAVLVMLLLAQGGLTTIETSREGLRKRSYFGIYTVRDDPYNQMRLLTHGTTLHGQQSTDPTLRRLPLTYYGPGSGAGIALANSAALFGPHARVGVVGLGTGSLACYRQAGQAWLFFEIDPLVLEYSRNRTFTYLADCAPDAKVVLGDARLGLSRMARGSLDILAVDAFSSDAIPLHLLTDQAFGVYLDALSPRGVVLVHISNRFIELEPVLAAQARQRGLAAVVRDDVPPANGGLTASSWVLMSRDPAQLKRLAELAPAMLLTPLKPPAPRAWTDDHASILPHLRWDHLLLTH